MYPSLFTLSIIFCCASFTLTTEPVTASIYFVQSQYTSSVVDSIHRQFYLDASSETSRAVLVHKKQDDTYAYTEMTLKYEDNTKRIYYLSIDWNALLSPYTYGTAFHFEIYDSHSNPYEIYDDDDEDFVVEEKNDGLLGDKYYLALYTASITKGSDSVYRLAGNVMTSYQVDQSVKVNFKIPNGDNITIDAYKYNEFASGFENWKFDYTFSSNVESVTNVFVEYEFYSDGNYHKEVDNNFNKYFTVSELGLIRN